MEAGSQADAGTPRDDEPVSAAPRGSESPPAPGSVLRDETPAVIAVAPPAGDSPANRKAGAIGAEAARGSGEADRFDHPAPSPTRPTRDADHGMSETRAGGGTTLGTSSSATGEIGGSWDGGQGDGVTQPLARPAATPLVTSPRDGAGGASDVDGSAAAAVFENGTSTAMEQDAPHTSGNDPQSGHPSASESDLRPNRDATAAESRPADPHSSSRKRKHTEVLDPAVGAADASPAASLGGDEDGNVTIPPNSATADGDEPPGHRSTDDTQRTTPLATSSSRKRKVFSESESEVAIDHVGEAAGVAGSGGGAVGRLIDDAVVDAEDICTPPDGAHPATSDLCTPPDASQTQSFVATQSQEQTETQGGVSSESLLPGGAHRVGSEGGSAADTLANSSMDLLESVQESPEREPQPVPSPKHSPSLLYNPRPKRTKYFLESLKLDDLVTSNSQGSSQGQEERSGDAGDVDSGVTAALSDNPSLDRSPTKTGSQSSHDMSPPHTSPIGSSPAHADTPRCVVANADKNAPDQTLRSQSLSQGDAGPHVAPLDPLGGSFSPPRTLSPPQSAGSTASGGPAEKRRRVVTVGLEGDQGATGPGFPQDDASVNVLAAEDEDADEVEEVNGGDDTGQMEEEGAWRDEMREENGHESLEPYEPKVAGAAHVIETETEAAEGQDGGQTSPDGNGVDSGGATPTTVAGHIVGEVDVAAESGLEGDQPEAGSLGECRWTYHPLHRHPLERSICGTVYPEEGGIGHCDTCYKTVFADETIHHCTTCAFDLCVNCLPPTEAWRLQNSVRIDAVIEWCFSKIARQKAADHASLKALRNVAEQYFGRRGGRLTLDLRDAILRGVREGRYSISPRSSGKPRLEVPIPDLDRYILWLVTVLEVRPQLPKPITMSADGVIRAVLRFDPGLEGHEETIRDRLHALSGGTSAAVMSEESDKYPLVALLPNSRIARDDSGDAEYLTKYMLRKPGLTLSWADVTALGVFRVHAHPLLAGQDWPSTNGATPPIGAPGPPLPCSVPGCTAVFAVRSARDAHIDSHPDSADAWDNCLMLQTLIQAGVVEPGLDALAVTAVDGRTYRATLNTDGILSVATTVMARAFVSVHDFVTGYAGVLLGTDENAWDQAKTAHGQSLGELRRGYLDARDKQNLDRELDFTENPRIERNMCRSPRKCVGVCTCQVCELCGVAIATARMSCACCHAHSACIACAKAQYTKLREHVKVIHGLADVDVSNLWLRFDRLPETNLWRLIPLRSAGEIDDGDDGLAVRRTTSDTFEGLSSAPPPEVNLTYLGTVQWNIVYLEEEDQFRPTLFDAGPHNVRGTVVIPEQTKDCTVIARGKPAEDTKLVVMPDRWEDRRGDRVWTIDVDLLDYSSVLRPLWRLLKPNADCADDDADFESQEGNVRHHLAAKATFTPGKKNSHGRDTATLLVFLAVDLDQCREDPAHNDIEEAVRKRYTESIRELLTLSSHVALPHVNEAFMVRDHPHDYFSWSLCAMPRARNRWSHFNPTTTPLIKSWVWGRPPEPHAPVNPQDSGSALGWCLTVEGQTPIPADVGKLSPLLEAPFVLASGFLLYRTHDGLLSTVNPTSTWHCYGGCMVASTVRAQQQARGVLAQAIVTNPCPRRPPTHPDDRSTCRLTLIVTDTGTNVRLWRDAFREAEAVAARKGACFCPRASVAVSDGVRGGFNPELTDVLLGRDTRPNVVSITTLGTLLLLHGKCEGIAEGDPKLWRIVYDGVNERHAAHISKRFPSHMTWSVLHREPGTMQGLRPALSLLTDGVQAPEGRGFPTPSPAHVLDALAATFDSRTRVGIEQAHDFTAKFCWRF